MKQKKVIVTHANPDLDAVAAVWLIKRFWNGWETAETLFVPAGETIHTYLEKDSSAFRYADDLHDADIVHVDTGMGTLDHHQDDRDTCAAKLVYEVIREARSTNDTKGNFMVDDISVQPRHMSDEALMRMVNEINDIDHFRQVQYPEASADRYQFMLVDILDGLNLLYNSTGSGDLQVLSHGMTALDGIYRVLQNKVAGEEELEGGTKRQIETKKGKAVGFETGNDAVLDIAQKMGYCIVVRKDKRKGYVRIKARPGSGIDLTDIYLKLKKKDPKATWFLHSSHAMLLNGSTKNPTMKPSSLSLDEIMEVIQECCN